MLRSIHLFNSAGKAWRDFSALRGEFTFYQKAEPPHPLSSDEMKFSAKPSGIRL